MKTRHSRVQKRIRTWLNMADCVRRMARWKSFCGARIRGGWAGDPPPGPRPFPRQRHTQCLEARGGPGLPPPLGWGERAGPQARGPDLRPELSVTLQLGMGESQGAWRGQAREETVQGGPC